MCSYLATQVFFLIKPHSITLSSQLQRQLFFHHQRFIFCQRLFIDMCIEAGAQEGAILAHQRSGNIIALFTSISSDVLLEALGRVFTRHAHIQTIEHAIKLRISCAKLRIFRENAFG